MCLNISEYRPKILSSLADLVHPYNATRHDSTGFSPYFLLFGRHPRLAIDAYFGLPSRNIQSPSRENYVQKLQKRLKFAYNVASKEAQKNAARHKARYDLRVREATLAVGDRVLVRNVGLRGKQKLADKWQRDPYIVVEIPNDAVPVYKVRKESGNGKIKTLHRNMLLPISSIPIVADVEQNLDLATSKRAVTKKQNAQSESESESSSSDSEVEYIVHRRTSDKNVLSVPLKETSSDYSSQSVSNSGISPSNGNDIFREPNVTSSNTGNRTENPIDVEPRRSTRIRKIPDRYGDWVFTQQTSLPELTEVCIAEPKR